MIFHDSIVQSGTGSAGWFFSSMWGLLLLECLRASSLAHWGGSTGTAEQLGAGWASLSVHQSYVAGLVSSQHGSLRVMDFLYSRWLPSGRKQK